MNILIDTHVFLWSVFEPEKLSQKHLKELETLSNTIYVSSISLVEIILKNSIGKLDVDMELTDIAEKSGFQLLDFSASDALALKDMPLYHKDPFDRMLIAQAINNNYYLMSSDRKFKQYACRLI